MSRIVSALTLLLLAIMPVMAAPPKPEAHITYRRVTADRKNVYDIQATYPIIAGDSPVIRLANQRIRAYAMKQVSDFRQMALDYRKDMADQKAPTHYALELTPTIGVARPDFVSMYFTEYADMDGAHPNTGYLSQTFGVVNGLPKLLTLKDLFIVGKDPYVVLSEQAIPKLKAREASLVVMGDIKRLDNKTLNQWVITPGGITLLFSPYLVASYAEGPFLVKIPFTELQGSLNPPVSLGVQQ